MTDDQHSSQPELPRRQRATKIRTSLLKTAAIASVASAATLALVRPDLAEQPSAHAPVHLPAGEEPVTVAVPAPSPTASQAADEPSLKLLTFIATRSRLRAERDGHNRVTFPAKFQRTSTHAPRIAVNEERLFEARRLAFESRQRDLRSKIGLVRDEIAGFQTQRDAKEQEISFIKEELRAIEKLHTRQLSNISRLMSLKRDLTRAQWDIGLLESSVARSNLSIKDIEQQIHEDRHGLVVDAERELRAIDLDILDTTKEHQDLPEPLLQLAAEAVRSTRR